MKELKCPNCGSTFTVDEAGYAFILQQVKTAEFDGEVQRRLAEIRKSDEQARALELEKQKSEAQSALDAKDREISDLQAKIDRSEAETNAKLAEKAMEMQKSLEVKEREIVELKAVVARHGAETDAKLAAKALEGRAAVEAKAELWRKTLAEKDAEIAELKADYAAKLKGAEEQIAFYKDMKARMSTKMIGETLETHCSTLYEQFLRFALPNATFEKDNEVVEGTKGDFVFRDFAPDKTEYVSIMFEMKNEADGTATKHKNEDFFKKLDEDRRKKNCEYAVLVSMLEPDNELYNAGIVSVAKGYEKMYVVRPQCFIPIITLLVQASRKAMEYKCEVAAMRRESVDVTAFEGKLQEFRKRFGYNCKLAKDKFERAIKEIDKSIKALEETKMLLVGSGEQLDHANDKVEKLTIRKLTYGNPTMQAKFAEARAVKDDAPGDMEAEGEAPADE